MFRLLQYRYFAHIYQKGEENHKYVKTLGKKITCRKGGDTALVTTVLPTMTNIFIFIIQFE